MDLNGKELSRVIKERIKEEVRNLDKKVKLLVILVGNDPASTIYVASKEKACKEVGIISTTLHLDENISQKELIQKIHEANEDPNIHAILVQLPLPTHLDEKVVINEINPLKDVDGLTNINQGKILNNLNCVVPATPKGVMHLFEEYKIDLTGKNAIVIGRSNLVGKPLAMLLLQKNATVTIAHSKTSNLKDLTKKMDVIVSAVGKPNFITADMVKSGAVVIDVGISRVDGKVIGDIKYEEVKDLASFITPVPGGVGPMTIASLLENVLECYKSI